MRTPTMTKSRRSRAAVTLGVALVLFGCATPHRDTDLTVLVPDPAPWIGAHTHVLFHYLGTPDAVGCSNGRVVLTYSALDRRKAGSAGVAVNFWIDDGRVVEVTGDPIDGPREQYGLPLWGLSSRRLHVPFVVELDVWNRRLGLADSQQSPRAPQATLAAERPSR